jgi:hypothetical protein
MAARVVDAVISNDALLNVIPNWIICRIGNGEKM